MADPQKVATTTPEQQLVFVQHPQQRRCYYSHHHYYASLMNTTTNNNNLLLLNRSLSTAATNTTSTTTTSTSTTTDSSTDTMIELKPSQVVDGLNQYIVGQDSAKRAVAIAMRNRWRRQQIRDATVRRDITPKNVLLIGPTGCGKTEIARRMALFNNAPFLKVEATKFTEVGYHGRDVDSIIRDLLDVSIQLTKKLYTTKFTPIAHQNVLEYILHQLAGPPIVASVSSSASTRAKMNITTKSNFDTTIVDPVTTEEGIAVETNGITATTSATTTNDDPTTTPTTTNTTTTNTNNNNNRGRESFREMLQQGMLDDQEIEIEIPKGGNSSGGGGGFTISSIDSDGNASNNVTAAVSEIWARMSGGSGSGASGNKRSAHQSKERKKVTIATAKELLFDIEMDKLLETVDLRKEAITAVEEHGIVFLDEIDKICSSKDSGGYGSGRSSADASAEGVQRDLLPLIEGTTISTKYGNVNTDYILFICSGAFHSVKPSDLLPELQGRLPIRVELSGLSQQDLYRILTEPINNLIAQQINMIATEGITLQFTDDAIHEIAYMAYTLNKSVENIGARRLHTVIERIMEEISFHAAEYTAGSTITVDATLVQHRLADVVKKTDVSKYIL